MRIAVWLLSVVILSIACLVACDYNLTITGPSGGTIPPISNTNTNTNTNNNDLSDVGATGSPSQGSPTGGSSAATLPLPSYGETIAQTLATANPILLGQSCKDALGDAAWAFLDLVVRTLRTQDVRWGYLCKDSQCLTFGRDVIAYRASAADTGIWIVDLISDCGTLNSFHWNVLAFDSTRRWSGGRIPGAAQ